VLSDLHQEFIRMVREARSDRPGFNTAQAGDELFSGAYWTGRRATELGLLDGNLSLSEAILQDCGADSMRIFEPQLRLFDMLGFFGR
jgi:ClpP class serine protease